MLDYDAGTGELENWVVGETEFCPQSLGKCESIMSLGNGYMGVRSCMEEEYLLEKRDFFINGTFNRFSDKEVSELPNLPDLINMEIELDGCRFTLEQGKILDYRRTINLRDGLLCRKIKWQNPNGKIVTFIFERFVSMARMHVIGSRVRIRCPQEVNVKIKSGINGQLTNTGTQHLDEDDMRFFEKKYLQYNAITTQSKVLVSLNTSHLLSCPAASSSMVMDRRRMNQVFTFTLKGEAVFEKLSVIYTSIDKECQGKAHSEIKEMSLEKIRQVSDLGFEPLYQESRRCWETQVWERYPINIESKQPYDQLALRFAIYHMVCMTPRNDNRMGIGGKGMTGEGYKGHSFWDTEIFILPFYIYSNPEAARSLLEYRYLGLAGAHKKARENGFKGAMYAWESAWPNDGEVTPKWGAVDMVTGKRSEIWSGFIEIHITCDVALAVWQYYLVTGDQDFMNRYGYEILFDTAIFWSSRYEWNAQKQQFEINDVVGPDEYKEHVNNNAFTNYVSARNLRLALQYYTEIKAKNPELFLRLNEKMKLDEQVPIWQDRLSKIYLPRPNAQNVIAQDDTYLSKKIIDLSKYKNQTQVGSVFNDYNMEQVNNMQISKQADIMMLFYEMEDSFPAHLKKANYDYYEPKTLHDSSLSLSTHSILANDLGEYDKAYDLFCRASKIDLGPNMSTSNDGVHAASLGGLWQCAVMGFGGLRMAGGKLRLNPRLPENWDKLKFRFYWKGKQVNVSLTKERLTLTSPSDSRFELSVNGKNFEMADKLEIKF